ncbi:MAG: hypothetical protein WC254_04795 [Candidatus Woesearchaeota archaeon]|jgi:DNA-binding Lrp family transcriptional regulator
MKPFSPKLDIISENIIYLLSLDSRLTTTDLSKLLGVNRKIVECRVNKLYKQKFIKPLLVFNHKTIIKTTILIKLTKFDRKILSALAELKKFVKVKETLGLYDFSLLVITQNEQQLQEILSKVNELFHDVIQNIDLVHHDIEDTLGYKSFCHELKFLQKYNLLKYDRDYQLTEEDLTLLEILKYNPLISYNEIISKTIWNYRKIKDSIQNLKDKGVIRFSVDPDYTRLGLEFHNLLLKVNLAEKEAFEKNVMAHPRIHWIKIGIGTWDYILSVAARDITEFIEIVRDIRTQNKDYILNVSSLISNIHVMRRV